MSERLIVDRAVSRRTVLGGAAAGLSLAAFSRYGFAQASPAVVSVAGDIAMLTGLGGNILVRPTSAGQVLVDSGSAQSSEALLEALRVLPGTGRVHTLFNTHWHLDQVGGNTVIGQAGATIVAHEKTRAHLATDYYVPAEDRYEKAQPVEAHPTETFFSDGEILIDGERVEYGHLVEAHTDGDIYVYFRDANVLAAGDAVSPMKDPELDWFGGGWLGGRAEA
ncbi:MAG: MBL fold metallo-hydrolase, partial [Gammaproteobacteria bacterium]|nr:MBL fold metallo-hydrolase [Gammaproteobacteria bacterium]